MKSRNSQERSRGIKKNQMENSELKPTAKRKILVGGLDSRMEGAEERISKLDDKTRIYPIWTTNIEEK